MKIHNKLSIAVVAQYYHQNGGTELLAANLAQALTGLGVNSLLINIVDTAEHPVSHDRAVCFAESKSVETILVQFKPDAVILLSDIFNSLVYDIAVLDRMMVKIAYINVNNQIFDILQSRTDLAEHCCAHLKNYDAVVTFFDDSVATHLFTRYNVPYHIIPNGIPGIIKSSESFKNKYGIPAGKKMLVYPGLIAPLKNQVALVQMAQTLSNDCLIVFMGNTYGGTPDYTEAFYQAVADTANCLYVGNVPREDVASAMEEAYLCLFPSLSEGAPLTLIEAMSAGLPWLTTPNVLFSRHIKGGVAVDLHSFPAVIECLSQDQSTVQTLGKLGKKCFGEKYRIEQTASSFIALIESLQQRVEKKEKILIDCVFFQFRNTGIARVWFNMLTEWAKTDFADSLLLLDRAETAPKIAGIRTRIIPAYDADAAVEDRVLLQQICDEEGAALFVSTYYTTPLTTPSVFYAYDMIPENTEFFDLSHPLWQMKHYGLRNAYAYIAISQSTAYDVIRFHPAALDKITVAYCAVDTDRFYVSSGDDISAFRRQYGVTAPYVVFIGDRAGYKNAELLFRALSLLKNAQDLEVVCVGGHSELEEYLAAFNPAVKVHVLQLNDDMLRAAYSGAAALTYPSVYEGFGLPILEAMACGCPVITCQNSSLPEVAGAAALYVREYNPEELLAAMYQIQQPEVRESLVQLGYRQVGKFSWQKMAQTVRDALKGILSTLQDSGKIRVD